MSNFAETIQLLSPAPDDAETDFVVPTQFELGSLRAIVNGLITDPSDTQWGYSELDNTTIRFVNAPKTGFVLQAFYREPVMTGSPFHPSGSYP